MLKLPIFPFRMPYFFFTLNFRPTEYLVKVKTLEQEESILARIREIFGGVAPNFSILEHQVDIKMQMEYFEFTKSQLPVAAPELLLKEEKQLYDETVNFESKKMLLVRLAAVEKPEAYRILERFVAQAPNELKDWAIMAVQECRMLLETRILDEQQVFISTGLGGKKGKLRYFIVAFSEDGEPFTETQQRLVRSEFEYALKRFKSEIEELQFPKHYFTLVALVPLHVQVRQPFQVAIEECNSLGPFIKKGFLITNVKVLDDAEIEEILNDTYNPTKYK